ncbi:MAG: glycine--tRNA ligase [Patescibacteria group bacterium]
MSNVSLDELTSLCKRRGFIYQGSEIYGGLAGTWDYGPLGVQLKRNIEQAWWKMFVEQRDDMYGLDSAILMNPKVWQASGHTGAGFADPLVEDLETKKRHRADHLLEDNGVENAEELTHEQMNKIIKERGIKSPDGNDLSEVRVFNLMFDTHVGPVRDDNSMSYLRPEIAQGMFVNFKNVVDSLQPDLPFGLAQSGKAFRNEISPREFLFRVREFNLMEFEYFIEESTWEERFEHFRAEFYRWCEVLGLDVKKMHELEVPEADRAHYSKRTVDFEYEFSFGTKEVGAIAYRTNFDLSNHMDQSGEKMLYRPKDGSDPFVPHVIEPTFGLDRMLLATLSEAYTEDTDNDRVYLALPEDIAPVKYCVSPLLKNKPELVARAREVYEMLQGKYGRVVWDDNGNIGKRYRRQDEIGTPWCVVIDFDTLEKDGKVSLRNRDTLEQTRLVPEEI